MNKLRSSGTYADYMLNIFVTKTFPNHHTISTGFYAETHGVTGASFYDEKLNKTFGLKDKELYHYNNDIIPIWVALTHLIPTIEAFIFEFFYLYVFYFIINRPLMKSGALEDAAGL